MILGLIVAFLTYGPNKKIGEGLGWSPSGAVVASVLMGLNSALCCGIIGYVVMQNIALVEMKKFGLKGGGLFGLRKKDVDIAIESLRTQEANMPPSAYPPRQ